VHRGLTVDSRRGGAMTSPELSWPGSMACRSSPQGAEEGEKGSGKSSRGSPEDGVAGAELATERTDGG
jgi:hypothetical protein